MRNTFVNQVNDRVDIQRVFPDLRFTCNGTITKWIIAGKIGGNDENNSLELQLWDVTSDPFNVTFIKKATSVVNEFNATDNMNVYEHFPDPPLEVQEGDILGLFQPDQSMLTMYFQPQGGPLNYGVSNILTSSLMVINPEDSELGQNDYPLVSVIISKSESVSQWLTT